MKAYFVDGVQHYLEAVFVKNAKEAKKIVPKWGLYQACCQFDHGTRRSKKTDLVFIEELFDLGILVHECMHAAICYVCEYEMPLAPKNATEEELRAHYEEAVCRIGEYLFRQLAFMRP